MLRAIGLEPGKYTFSESRGWFLEESDITFAKAYHEATKHSPTNVREVQSLDWENKPSPYKVYLKLIPIKLPSDFPHPTQDTIGCVSSYDAAGGSIDIRTIAELLHFSAGITKRIKSRSKGVFDFRAAAATGALYEVEAYLVASEVPGLEAGVYHFNPQEFSLRQLRTGDYRSFLYSATGERAGFLSAPAIVILTAIYWRNAWKYQARAYRHFFWDAGTIIANLLATSVSAQLKAEVILGFVDQSVNHLLGLNIAEETAVAIVPVGTGANSTGPSYEKELNIPKISFEAFPLSKRKVEYPEILWMHSASSFNSSEEAKGWHLKSSQIQKPKRSGEAYSLQPLHVIPKSPLGRTIIRRGSTRQFSRESIPFSYLSTILQNSTLAIPADFLKSEGSTMIDLYLIVNAVDGLPSGAYYYDVGEGLLELLKTGDFRDTAGYLCLEQGLGTDGSAAVFLMSHLDALLASYGNRGYRAAQLEAGIRLGKMYLCAYALGIGASGITFYDDAITDFFSPHAAGTSAMAAAILGVPAYGKRPQFLAG